MNVDERLDARIRAALEWEADRSAASQSSFPRAMVRLASRVQGMRRIDERPGVRAGTVSQRALGLLTATLLLAALIAALVIAGSRQNHSPSDLDPGPFGLATPCSAALADGVEHEFVLPDERRRVRFLDDGSVLTAVASGEDGLAHPDENATYTRQRLTAAGRARVAEAVQRLGLTPGCRVHYGAPVTFLTRVPGGVARLQTSSWPGAYAGYELLRVMTAVEEQAAITGHVQLTTDLQTYVGSTGWLDASPITADPSTWSPEPTLPGVTPPPLPEGNLSQADACALVLPATVDADRSAARPSPLRFSHVSPACELLKGTRRMAIVSVRGQSATLSEARAVVAGLFGGDGQGEAPAEDGRIWFNPCWLEGLPCPEAVAGWLDGHLVVIVMEPTSIGATSSRPLTTGGQVVRDAFRNLRALDVADR